MDNNKQQFHFGKWDCVAFLGVLFAIYKIIKALSQVCAAYFNNTKRVIIEEK